MGCDTLDINDHYRGEKGRERKSTKERERDSDRQTNRQIPAQIDRETQGDSYLDEFFLSDALLHR